jgi:hypothetical protein
MEFSREFGLRANAIVLKKYLLKKPEHWQRENAQGIYMM